MNKYYATIAAALLTSISPLTAIAGTPIFPNISAQYGAARIGFIDSYATQQKMHPLSNDCVRLFCQPMGVVSMAIEIDFTQNRLTVYPGTHSTNDIVSKSLAPEQAAAIKDLVGSEEFRTLTPEKMTAGMDGTSYLVESLIDNAYLWKLHWQPDDPFFRGVIDRIISTADDILPLHKPKRASLWQPFPEQ